MKKTSLKYATMPIFVSISFKLVFLHLKEIVCQPRPQGAPAPKPRKSALGTRLRICMGKARFALQSRFNDFHTNPCTFLNTREFHTLFTNEKLLPSSGVFQTKILTKGQISENKCARRWGGNFQTVNSRRKISKRFENLNDHKISTLSLSKICLLF